MLSKSHSVLLIIFTIGIIIFTGCGRQTKKKKKSSSSSDNPALLNIKLTDNGKYRWYTGKVSENNKIYYYSIIFESKNKKFEHVKIKRDSDNKHYFYFIKGSYEVIEADDHSYLKLNGTQLDPKNCSDPYKLINDSQFLHLKLDQTKTNIDKTIVGNELKEGQIANISYKYHGTIDQSIVETYKDAFEHKCFDGSTPNW